VRSLRSALLVAQLVLALAWGGAACAADEPLTPQQVRAAVEATRVDPLLGGMRVERKLRWKDDADAPQKKKPDSAPPAAWLLGLVRWLAEGARLLMWLLGASAVAILVVLLRRWVLVRGDGLRGRPIVLPSHVRDLDIRPESLPDDIAGAARALWQRGEQRACLSLLYRGALSRLVHGHAVPIRAASTEGECVRLAVDVLPSEGGSFVRRLVDAWLLSVYAARVPDEAGVLGLCDEFDRRLPAQPAATGSVR